MTIRKNVSTIHNYFNDSQRVDRSDMNVEQTHKIANDAAIVNNHFGSGVLPNDAQQKILFDFNSLTTEQASLLASGDFDGVGHDAHAQPSDSNLGNQLEVELTGPTGAFGRLNTKVLIIGLDFAGNPQYDRFVFHKAEKQVTRKHYTQILSIFFNDYKGNNNCSRNLGGTIVIRETEAIQLSRDPIMVAQDTEPNLFFRDFKVYTTTQTLAQAIQAGMGSEYSFDALSINTTVKINRQIVANDVTTKIGQKFKATTNNIQKITLLLGAGRNDSAPIEDRFDWSGEIVISVYELQTTVSCPTDIVPELAIEFDPQSQPLAQLSFSQQELYDLGYVLTDVLQPVDFVFSDTQLGSTSTPLVVPGRFYAVTINRAGAAANGSIFTGVGNNVIEDSRLTLYFGTWADVPEEDLWFQVWTDAAKVADGQAYDAGQGVQVEKTAIDESTAAEVDYAFDEHSFSDTGENILNIAIIQAIQDQSVEEQDERTGNPVFSRQKFEPSFSFVTSAGLSVLQSTSEPLIIGCAQDVNPKLNEDLEKTQTFPGLAKGDTFTIINPDADLLSNNLVGSKLIPNTSNAAKEYRIFKVLSCVDGYGDVNGDGVIDSSDLARLTALIGESLSSSSTQQKIADGYVSTLEIIRGDVDGDGTITANDTDLLSQYIARTINGFPVGSSFTHLELQVQQSIGRFDGYYDCDGYIRNVGDGYGLTDPSTLDPYELLYDGYITTPSIDGSDAAFNTVPFSDITYQVLAQPFWQDYMLAFSSDARKVPVSLTFADSVDQSDCDTEELLTECNDRLDLVVPECEPGRNDILFPDNIIMARGQILTPDGSYFPVDFEVGQVILEIPAEEPLSEAVIDIFNNFVADAGSGLTSAGYSAMKFADCSTVGKDALGRNQVRFDVAIQAFNPNLDGYSDDGYELIVDNQVGIYLNNAEGILTLTLQDLAEDPIFQSLVTKIQITVYLKKAGWKNTPLVISSDQISGLIS